MIIENAKPTDWQNGDIVDVKGMNLDKHPTAVRSNLETLKSFGGEITLHRKSRIEKIQEEIAILQSELEKLSKPPRKKAKSIQPHPKTNEKDEL